MSTKVMRYTADGLSAIGVPSAGNSGSLPKLSALPAPVRNVVENAFGHGVADVFLYGAPFALAAVVAILFVKEVPLRTTTGTPVATSAQAVTAPAPATAAAEPVS
jgi:hypothetical protein